MTAHKRLRVVIVGAGFGGLWAARALASSPVEVLLLDRNNYHTFLPLLYQVAAAKLEPEQIATSVRSILRKLPNVHLAIADVKRIDLADQVVVTGSSLIPYDFLILAAGSTSQFFGVPGADQYAFPLKTLEQAVSLRNRIFHCFERAVHEPNGLRRQQLLTFVIVGGGPTGVEFAGALAELIHSSLVKDYPTLDFREVRVVLLQAADSLLPSLPERLRTYAEARLRKMGVEVRLQTRVSQVTQEAVHLQNSRVIPTATVVWTAGVRGNSLDLIGGLPTANHGRVAVLPTLQMPGGDPNVYVIGDLASVDKDGRLLPMLAPVAMQQGITTARNIARQIAGRNALPFRYQHKGTMVIIGRHAAVAHLGKLALTGFPAWVLWLGVHLVNLLGFRNRLLVLINWVWGYLFKEHVVRLILPSETVLTSKAPSVAPDMAPAPRTKAEPGKPHLVLKQFGETP